MKYFAQIPRIIADLLILGTEMADGLTKLAQSLGITQITAAQMKSDTDAVVQADKAFNASRSARQTAFDNFRPADAALSEWLGKASATLSTFFGKRWSQQWVQAGFINPTITIPSTIDDRAALALRVITFLAANPSYEAPTLGVTAANGTTLRNAALTAQNAVTAADQDLDNKGTARQAAIDALTSRMRMLIGILAEILNSDDTRWLDFGLEMPAKLTTPAPPSGLNVTVSPATVSNDAPVVPDTVNVLLTCDPAPFATRYRWRMRIVGLLGSNYELVASTTEPMAQVAVPIGATVEFIVQAVNINRQSVACEAVIFTAPATLPAAAKAAEAITAREQTTPPAAASGDGHANGNRLPALS